MAGRTNFNELRKKMSPERRARSAAKAKILLNQIRIKELIKEHKLTQTEIADLMGIKQSNLSRMLRQNDMKVSVMRELVEALGGHVELVAHMPDGDYSIQLQDESGKEEKELQST